jgi:hypothetical protein
MNTIQNAKLKMKNGKPFAFAFFIFTFSFFIVHAAEMGDAIDTVANGKLLDVPYFTRYGYQPTKTIIHDPQGIRFYLPASQQSIEQTGIYSSFTVAGDFEISATYDVTSISPPVGGYGASVGIVADTDGPGGMIALARGIQAGKGPGYMVTRGTTDGGEKKYDGTHHPTTAKTGRLVLRREKKEVICLVSDTPQEEPHELARMPFPQDSIKVRLVADNGGSHTTVDARLNELRIRGFEIVGGIPKYEPPKPWGWWWWAGLGLMGFATVGVVGLRFRSGHWVWSRGDD